MTTENENKVNAENETKEVTTDNKVNKRRIVAMSKKDKRDNVKAVLTRIKEICKTSDIKVTKLSNVQCEKVHSQAALIDYMIRNNQTFDAIVEQVAVQFYNNDRTKSYARVKRHIKHDQRSRIVKRNAILNAMQY